MAANMIGVKKRILVFSIGNIIVLMVNPVILKKKRKVMKLKRVAYL